MTRQRLPARKATNRLKRMIFAAIVGKADGRLNLKSNLILFFTISNSKI